MPRSVDGVRKLKKGAHSKSEIVIEAEEIQSLPERRSSSDPRPFTRRMIDGVLGLDSVARERAALARKREEAEEKRKSLAEAERREAEAARERKEAEKKRLAAEKRREKTKLFFRMAGRKSVSFLKLSACAFALAVSSVFVFYLCFAFILLNFHPSGSWARKIESVLPVPAIISRGGIITYFDYQDFSANFSEDENQKFAELLAVRKLAKRYGIDAAVDFETLRGEVAEQSVFDPEVNEVSLARIKKIRSLSEAGDLFGNGKKFADSWGETTLGAAEAEKKFGSELSGLEAGQLSGVLAVDGGYALVRINKKDNDRLFFVYASVKAGSFGEYLKKETARLKIFNLAE